MGRTSRQQSRTHLPAIRRLSTSPGLSQSTTKHDVPASATTLQIQPSGADQAPASVAFTKQAVYLYDNASSAAALHPIPLRESCLCGSCRDSASGQKKYTSVDIPSNIYIADAAASEQGLAIKFGNDIPRYAEAGHVTHLPWDAVQTVLGRISPAQATPVWPASALERTGVTFWDARTLDQQIRRIDYDEFMAEGDAFWEAVADISRLGLVFISNVPRDEDSVVRITTRIANIKETFYGRTFDVRAKPDAENVAYTSGYLGLHQDLMYLKDPPMIQVLHCMDNSCQGGESLFSDGERAARILWDLAGERVTTDLVPYEYAKHGYSYRRLRPLVQLDDKGEFENVFWSPPFQGRHDGSTLGEGMEKWLVDAKTLHEAINHPDAMWQAKMKPGECVIFNNLRVMHGRTAFDAAGGSRWLRGTYIAADDFLSKACYVPDHIAEKSRGTKKLWNSKAAGEALRKTSWHGQVKVIRDGLKAEAGIEGDD